MQTVAELLAQVPSFQGLHSDTFETVAGCGRTGGAEKGEYLMREGEPADTFYVVRSGHVALEIFVPQRGAVTVETIGPGELVGWSWLVEPFRSHLDARAIEDTRLLTFDAACLRGKCDADPALGYELMRRFVPVIVERLMATRVRMLDVYGHAAGA